VGKGWAFNMSLWSQASGRNSAPKRAAGMPQKPGSLLLVGADQHLQNLSARGFQSEYARQEIKLIGSIERYLLLLIVLQLVVYVVPFFVVLSTLSPQVINQGWPIPMAILLPTLSAVLFLWPVLLARRYFSLQRTKRIWMDNQDINFREDARKMSDSILAAAQRRVTQNIKIQGNQSQIVVAGGDVKDVTQTLVISGSKERVEGLALLIEYAKGSGNAEAVKLAKYIAKESENAPVNRSVLFDCWTKLTSILPGVADITKIATAVKALFV
jgi:hypothetical protein